MKRLTIVLAVGAVLLLCCNCSVFDRLTNNHNQKVKIQVYNKATPIPFTQLRNYYVRNDVNCSKLQQLILKNKADFEAFFGMAAYMGGLPTEVNWDKQYVLALILPETNRETTITPIDVRQDGDKVVLCYHVEQAQETMSYTIVPFTAVAIDKPETSQELKIYFLEQ